MTSNDFNLLMDSECSRCKQAAKFHRITPSGTSYCLEFNRKVSWRPINSATDDNAGYRQRLVYRCKVDQLVRSPLPTTIGKLINSELKVLAEVTV